MCDGCVCVCLCSGYGVSGGCSEDNSRAQQVREGPEGIPTGFLRGGWKGRQQPYILSWASAETPLQVLLLGILSESGSFTKDGMGGGPGHPDALPSNGLQRPGKPTLKY